MMTSPPNIPATPSLDQVQRWMQAVIFDPDGIESGLASEAARDQISVGLLDIEEVIDASQTMTSVERLQVYSNAYYARLLECMRDEFPALAHALGDETFEAFAFGYLQSYPSSSYTLCDLGANFPRFFAETRPADEDDPELFGDSERTAASWPDFLIDIATVERLYSEVFSGPGVEGQSILQPEDVSKLSPTDFAAARLVPVPCLRLLKLRYPVHEYISAVRHETTPTLPEPAATNLVVTRRQYVVRRCTADPVEFELLQSLQSGQAIGAAIESVASRSDEAYAILESELQNWFRQWAVAGFFQRIELPE